MNNITYLLGAGASASSIPVVNQFGIGVQEFDGRLRGINYGYSGFVEGFKKHVQEIGFLDELTKFKVMVEENPTIDTHAKRLFLKEDFDELFFLKKWFSIFFLYRHYMFSIDERYDKFFAAILNKNNGNIVLPKHVKILSWNYDFQLELAYLRYTHSQKQLNDLNIFSCSTDDFDQDEFGCIKLNGTVGKLFKNKLQIEDIIKYDELCRNVQNTDEFQKIGEIVRYFEKFTEVENNQIFRYAWEDFNSAFKERLIMNAKKIAEETDVLVIIGYSFPYVNLDIDREIFNSLDRIHTIYIQNDEYKDTSKLNYIKQRFPKIVNKKIENVIQGKEFYLPNELFTRIRKPSLKYH